MRASVVMLAGMRLLVALGLLLSCARPGEAPRVDATEEHVRRVTQAVDDERLRNAGADPGNWLTHGRTYAETRYSPLDQIHAGNAAELGLLWSYDLATRRGVEATPIAIDGFLFVTAPWSVVHAVDARTGRALWTYDPQVPRRYAELACCDVVNRGVAVYRGRVYAGTLDGRLLALDAATGRLVWEVLTVDQKRPYSVTGAPRIVKGKVVIGNGGAEFGVRGYVSAYDAESGALVWRTYTVPGDPSQPFESEALARAAVTWSGSWWKAGGGGTVWDSMAYDPELDLLYVGTGNGSPWSRYARSPGGGDNLYVSSILALRPDDGSLVWHFQSTPGDNWDYTATQPIHLAELEIDGSLRKVLMQAPKNGFFYVLDRETGAFLSARPFVEVTWAKGLDPKTGRPTEADDLDYREGPVVVKPSTYGGHNWHPMSFNPQTGLVYLPAQEIPSVHLADAAFSPKPFGWNTGTDFAVYRDLPREAAKEVTGRLLAWDPVRQREAWRVEHGLAWNGGTLTTAGNLVFQGTADGRFVAYRADDGTRLWEAPAQTGVIAGPVSYLVDGRQVVSVMVGWGGVFALAAGDAARAAGVRSVGRLLTFGLGGTATLPEADPLPDVPPPPAFALEASAEEVRRGGTLYQRSCGVCHGLQVVGGGVIPDLRFASRRVHEEFVAIVLGGTRQAQGMPSFAGRLESDEVRAIQAYVLARAREDAAAGGAN